MLVEKISASKVGGDIEEMIAPPRKLFHPTCAAVRHCHWFFY